LSYGRSRLVTIQALPSRGRADERLKKSKRKRKRKRKKKKTLLRRRVPPRRKARATA